MSKKKSRFGSIQGGFHFLGMDYPGTQTPDNINENRLLDGQATKPMPDPPLSSSEGNKNGAMRVVRPHPRTLRNAREQVKLMVQDGFSTQRIRSYLHRWAHWWARTSETWSYHELLMLFTQHCWDKNIGLYAQPLLIRHYRMLQLQAKGSGITDVLWR